MTCIAVSAERSVNCPASLPRLTAASCGGAPGPGTWPTGCECARASRRGRPAGGSPRPTPWRPSLVCPTRSPRVISESTRGADPVRHTGDRTEADRLGSRGVLRGHPTAGGSGRPSAHRGGAGHLQEPLPVLVVLRGGEALRGGGRAPRGPGSGGGEGPGQARRYPPGDARGGGSLLGGKHDGPTPSWPCAQPASPPTPTRTEPPWSSTPGWMGWWMRLGGVRSRGGR